MFESAFRTITRSARDTYTDSDRYEVCGTTIAYKNDMGSDWDEWETLFEKWIPRFREAGWMEDLERFEVGESFVNGGGVAEYRQKEYIVAFKDDPSIVGQPYLVGTTKDYAIVHEMAHHVHIRDMFDLPSEAIEDTHVALKQEELDWDRHTHKFDVHVSEYASTNFLEAVAETCAGITMGHEYPNSILRAYQNLEGPEPLENWEEPEPSEGEDNLFRYDGPTVNDMHRNERITLGERSVTFHYDAGNVVIDEDGLSFEKK